MMLQPSQHPNNSNICLAGRSRPQHLRLAACSVLCSVLVCCCIAVNCERVAWKDTVTACIMLKFAKMVMADVCSAGD